MMLYFLVEEHYDACHYTLKKSHQSFDNEEAAIAALVLHPDYTNMAVMVVDINHLEDLIEDNCTLIRMGDLKDYVFGPKFQKAQNKRDEHFEALNRKREQAVVFFTQNPKIAIQVLGKLYTPGDPLPENY